MSRNKSDEHLVSNDSRWDKLPKEIKDEVFEYTSPLTLFLNERLGPLEDLHPALKRTVWLEVIDNEWPGDLSLLLDPPDLTLMALSNKDISRTKSREMYNRLCERLPNATESNADFELMDKYVQAIHVGEQPPRPNLSSHYFGFALRLINIPLRHMWFDLIQDMIDKYPYAVAEECIRANHADLFRHLLDTGKIDFSNNRRITGGIGRHMVSMSAMTSAADHGCLDILKILHELGYDDIGPRAMDYASHGDHSDVVKWLIENRDEGCTESALNAAAEQGNMTILELIHQHYHEHCSEYTMTRGAANGHLNVIKFYCKKHPDMPLDRSLYEAVKHGHVKIVKFLLDRITNEPSDEAVQDSKTYEIAKLLVEKISSERKTELLERAEEESWQKHVVDALKKA